MNKTRSDATKFSVQDGTDYRKYIRKAVIRYRGLWMERCSEREKTGIAVFDHFGLSGSRSNSIQQDTCYKQLSIKTLMKDTQPSNNHEK